MVGPARRSCQGEQGRIRAALKNVGFNFPLKQITVNLAPADSRRKGSSFDLPIAIGIMRPRESFHRSPRTVHPVRGALARRIGEAVKGALRWHSKRRGRGSGRRTPEREPPKRLSWRTCPCIPWKRCRGHRVLGGITQRSLSRSILTR